MERRGFLAGLAAGAVGWLAAGRTGTALDVYAHAVPFVPGAEAAAFNAAFTIDEARTAASQASTFAQSVASGDPNPNGAVLWTRVDPGAIVTGITSLVWQIGTDPGFGTGTILLQGTASIPADRDNTISLPIANTVLSPFSVYYYQFIYNGVASRTGRFKTLPAPTDKTSQVVIGTANCQDWSNGFYNAWAYLAQENLDVVLFLGDYIYEYRDDGVGGPGGGPVRVVPPYPSGAAYPASIDDYRHLYQTYRSDPNIQAAHEKFAFIFMWDDHEFFNDCHQDFHPDTDPAGVSYATPQPALRAAANQAWNEYCPAAVPFNPALGWEQQITVYRSFAFGQLAKLVITDLRLYRDGPPCGSTEIGGRYFTAGCGEQYASNRSMLGSTQKAWFMNQVESATATWKIWASEVMVAQYKYGVFGTPAAVFFDLDAWDGYVSERTNILNTFASKHVKNFVVFSGDAHLFCASYLKASFNSLFAPDTAIEFTMGPISSGNYADSGFDALPAALSAPEAARAVAKAGVHALDTLEPVVLLSNPHMKFWNGSSYGYGVVTITAASLNYVFKAVSTVKQMGATMFTLANFTVPAGQVQINGG